MELHHERIAVPTNTATLINPNVSPGNAMIVPRSLFRCGFALESIAKLLMIEPIPQQDDEIGTRVRSARLDHTLSFADIPGIFNKK